MNITSIMNKITYAIGALSSMSFVLGWTFAILNLPGATELSSYGFLVFGFVFMPLLAFARYRLGLQRQRMERLTFNFAFISSLLIAISILFKLMHLQGAEKLMLTGAVIFTFVFIPLLFISLYKNARA